jgi:hypothetical protein
VPDVKPAAEFILKYGLEKARELCFQYELRELDGNSRALAIILRDGHDGWREAPMEDIQGFLDDVVYDGHVCEHCKDHGTPLDLVAQYYVILPIPDYKVDDVVGGTKS